MSDANERRRDARRQVRIDEAARDLLAAMHAVERFAAAIRRDGITLDNCGGADLPRVRERLIAAAEQIRLAEVYGIVEDEDIARIKGGEDR